LKESKELDSFLSKKLLEKNILGLANIFKNVAEFFIPVRMDNRGRIYCIPSYLNYQSTELAKSLLLFSKGEKIFKDDKIALDYLKIFGANCYGNGLNKESFADRINWINEHEEDILDFKNGKLINEADSKLLFIAFCFEYLNYKNSFSRNDTYYISYFPIQLDGTSNGFQHIALLTGNNDLASELNLIASDKTELPKDFYMFITVKLKDYFTKEILRIKNLTQINNELNNENLVLLNSYEKLLEMDINRKIVKTAIMVKPYNASLYQMSNYIKDQFKEVKENGCIYYYHPLMEDKKFTSKDINILTKSIEKVLFNEFPKLKCFINYLNEVAGICSELNIPITWTVPSGLIVNQYYVDSEAIRLKPFFYKKNTYTLKVSNKKLNRPKQIRALMPNLIHSLDASSLALLVELFFSEQDIDEDNSTNINNFYSIHDCFAVTANNIDKLINVIKVVYISIYSDDQYIRKFDQGIIDSIKLHLGKNSFNDSSKTIEINNKKIQYPDINTFILGIIKAESIKKSSYIIN
jgi:DNA-directed RNA polymerase, mitochondrial